MVNHDVTLAGKITLLILIDINFVKSTTLTGHGGDKYKHLCFSLISGNNIFSGMECIVRI
jgi:hypothetical protein